ncbi:dipeptide/oligopeptide/nickel ABC transporter permease/ATP-binding protein [Paracoccus sp. (in: a-proteobacteria)]|uniref:dipeptide/oligopeptide/nickel ABC transporter permease/ATP-binding protein n=1 Tax=Paracoccus sp. TaxID=267 RepID=UPI0026DED81A|nr:dipeptide/oligopeptide/nickel ABC transporter permease/ATP-binding protein [Paracoccus sp. (in: a-proteobacteria)]MDO5648488.1 dipeptide/oligopeptide/nickel ABC transporter permease/ATP-binding protein [Paracoccus sp. (in: a-proteobacteria)]
MLRAGLTERLSVPGLRLAALRSLPLSSRVALVFLVLVALIAVFAPLIATHNPLSTGLTRGPAAPDAAHWFGTDRQGRDIFSRLVYGARYSLVIGLAATGVALAVAAVLASIAATAHQWLAEVLMRALDMVMSFPGIALAAVFVTVFGQSLPVLVLTIAFLYVPQLTRVIRANIIDQYGEDYVAAVRVMGAPTHRILLKHVARNCLAPILVFATVLVADAIVFEASLSFIQAGVPDPEPSWGNVIAAGRQLVMSGAWWPTFFAGMLITTTVLALNIVAEGMTDAMAAPRARANVSAAKVQAEIEAAPEAHTPGPDLADSLAQLRAAELARGDRLIYPGDDAPLLQVRNLSIGFPRHGDVDVVDNISFDVRPGETMALVGESGCGKSITALAIMGLLDPKARIRGEILFNGENLLTMTPRQRNALRGRGIAMIYQDALSALNPAMLIRSQMAQLTSRGGTRSAHDLLQLVGLDPDRTLNSYPHELSGGQRQRVLIAMALTRDPKLVIADEPTTALDVTVQKQVIELLNRLRQELGFAMVFVSHDLALVAEISHRISVMYAGQMVEQGPTSDILTQPVHEYTRGLLGAVLSIEAGAERLHQVRGTVPSPRDFPPGDRFAPRSSDPARNAGVTRQMRRIDGTDHWYAAHPDDAPTQRLP